ncbi:MAG: hypothetical protein ACE5KM_16435 [Planctomycetaceae bacterium]
MASLVKKVDAKAGSFKGGSESKLRSFVVLLSDDPDADQPKLEAFAKKHNIKNVPLTIFDGVAGPPKYKIAEKAEVTVMLWVKTAVKANHAFAKGEFNAKGVNTVMKSLPKILE